MKYKLALVALVGLLAARPAIAQDSPVGDASPVAPAVETTSTETPDATAPSPTAPDATPDVIIPLIQFQDVPLTTAIENLARQANLNYILDPKVNFGQPDEKGVVRPQPNLTLRWENLSAQQALNAVLNNYSLQMVEDPKTRIFRVTVRDPAAPDPLETRIIQLKYSSPSNMVVAVKATLTDKRSVVVPDNRTSQLVVVATAKELVAVDDLVERLDTPTKQVLIEARLVETAQNPRTSKGIDWSGTLQAQQFSFGNNTQTKPVTSGESDNAPLATDWPKLMLDTAKGFNPSTAFLDADGVSAVLSFLNTSAEAKVLSSPRTVTVDNETASISVTRASPIINVTPGTANTTGGSQITYTNLGVLLHVTPRIAANSMVNLKVVPEVSRIFQRERVVVDNGIFEADSYDIRRMETTVMIPSGNTLVMGGLVQDDVRNSGTKVPILGDVPGLGRAFRSDSKSRAKNNLLVFITPTIVEDSDFQPTKTDFLGTPVPSESEVEWTAWDSAKPLDWSKPIADQYKAKAN